LAHAELFQGALVIRKVGKGIQFPVHYAKGRNVAVDLIPYRLATLPEPPHEWWTPS
jgi:hypothetical protein